MKKLFLALAISSTLGLSGCLSDGDKAPVTENDFQIAAVRVVFDPGAGKLTVPTDILLSGTTDGTLNLPVANPDDFSDPQAAISALDGWSTTMPFEFEFDGAFDQQGNPIHVNGASVEQPGAVLLHQAVMGGDASVPPCEEVPSGAVCLIEEALQYGEDYIVRWSNKKAQVVLLKPLQAKTGYVVSITDRVVDELGRSLQPSTTYYTLSKPLDTDPIGGATEQALQGMINSQRLALSDAGVDVGTVIHTNSFTTQSIDDVLQVVKKLYLSPDLAPQLQAQPLGRTVAELLVGAGQLPADPTNPSFAVASTADVYAGTVGLPYFSSVPTAEDPAAPLTGRWEAAAVSPASVLMSLQQGQLSQEELAMLLVSLGHDPQEVLQDPTKLAGAIPYSAAPAVLYNSDYIPGEPESGPRGFDQTKSLTKYNPIPQVKAIPQVPFLMAVPDEQRVNAVRTLQGLDPITEPANGWPIVIFQHGITGSKENVLAIAGTLSLFGHAVIAIDHPLHGDRGFAGGINATTGLGSPTNYLNLASLLTARDNLRQSTADLLGLRVALSNGLAQFGGAVINGLDVKFVGHSLGAIAGHNFVAIANDKLEAELAVAQPLYQVQAMALGMPGTGIAPFLVESPGFGPLIGGMLAMERLTGFAQYAVQEAMSSGVEPGSPEFAAKLPEYYVNYFSGGIASAEEIAERDALLAQFQFAAQTVIDSGDPASYITLSLENDTPTFFIEAVGDTTIPNETAHPIGGSEPFIRLLGLAPITGATLTTSGQPISGAARYLKGGHSGLLSPADDAATTANQQQVIGAWFESGMLYLAVDEDLVKQ